MTRISGTCMHTHAYVCLHTNISRKEALRAGSIQRATVSVLWLAQERTQTMCSANIATWKGKWLSFFLNQPSSQFFSWVFFSQAPSESRTHLLTSRERKQTRQGCDSHKDFPGWCKAFRVPDRKAKSSGWCHDDDDWQANKLSFGW